METRRSPASRRDLLPRLRKLLQEAFVGGSQHRLDVVPESRGLHAEAVGGAWLRFVNRHAVARRPEAQQPTRSFEIHEIHAVAPQGFDEAGEECGRIEAGCPEVAEVPVGVLVGVTTRARPEQEEDAQT